MRFIYERGATRRRVMHIARHSITGEIQMKALCGIDHYFNTTCNLPLGKKICKRCWKIAEQAEQGVLE